MAAGRGSMDSVKAPAAVELVALPSHGRNETCALVFGTASLPNFVF